MKPATPSSQRSSGQLPVEQLPADPRDHAGRRADQRTWAPLPGLENHFAFLRGLKLAIVRTMWTSFYEGALTTLFLTWTSGMVLTGYMLYLGGSPLQVAMIASIPLIAQLTNPVMAWLLGVVRRPKLLTILLTIIGRGLWLVAGLLPVLKDLPLVGMPDSALPNMLILIMVLSYVMQHGAGTIWSAWMGEVIPEDRRGSYFGFRSGALSIVGLTASLSAGIFLDHAAAPLSYMVVLTIAVAMAFGGIYFYSQHHEPVYTGHRLALREIVMAPLQDPNFRRFIVFLAYWQFVVLVGATFVFPYFIEYLELKFAQIAIYQSIAAVTTLLCAPIWGKVADRVGNKAVLAITTFIAGSALPATWIFARPGDPTIIYISGVVDGIAWSAIGPCMFNLSLTTAPKEKRAAYLAMLGVVTGITGFIGGLIAAPLLGLFSGWEFDIIGMHWSGYHWLFFVSSMMRVHAWRLLRPVKEQKAWRTREVLRAMLSYRFIGFFWR